MRANVPGKWVGQIIPQTPNGVDYGTSQYGFSRNWQTFWAMTITSMILSMVFVAVKCKETRPSEDIVVSALFVLLVITGLSEVNSLFGSAGINAALSCGYIFFETTQYDFPNA